MYDLFELSGAKICQNLERMKSARVDFDSFYQILHNYFYVEAGNVTDKKNPGAELHTLLDSTSLDCADVLAAGLSNYLTPESSKWVYLEHSNPAIRDNDDVKAWMYDVSQEVLTVLAHSNFYNQMPIFYKASGVYGTSTIVCESDEDDGIRFFNVPIRNAYISEDSRERPREFYLIYEFTAEQAVERFGKACSQEIQQAYAACQTEKKFKFCCYVGKRIVYDPEKRDKMNMPVRQVWVDMQTKAVLKEDGFFMLPCMAHRFYKRPQIVYGYSPAMKALPFVRMANTLSDTMLRAAMKQADPPIALPDDAFLGVPNFNPRQINYYQRGKLSPADEIVPIGNYGNPAVSFETLDYYQNQIRRLMFYDTFQAFSGLTKQMTVPEVQERIAEKMTLLGPAVGRFMNDVLQPLIERVVTILFHDGRLPPLPDAMLSDPRYDVKFTGRLVQAQRQSEVSNIVNALAIAGQIAQMDPEVVDKIDGDSAVEEIVDITGVTTRLLRSDMEVEAIRRARAEQAAQAQALAQQAAAAETYKTAATGDREAANADRLNG